MNLLPTALLALALAGCSPKPDPRGETWEDGLPGVMSLMKLSLEANGHFDFGEQPVAQSKPTPDYYVSGTWVRHGDRILLTEEKVATVYLETRVTQQAVSVLPKTAEFVLSGGRLKGRRPLWRKDAVQTIALVRKSAHPSHLIWPKDGVRVNFFSPN